MFKAFTLAEVLVTLTILGILASIIVPNVIQQYQKRVTITKLKKAYATLEGAAANLASATGCMGKGLECTGLMEISDDKIFSDRFVELSGLKIISNKRVDWVFVQQLTANEKMTHASFSTEWIYTASHGIVYAFHKRKIYSKNFYGDNSKNAIIVRVITEPKKIYSNSNEIKQGRNIFGFVIYENFIVEPYVVAFGGSHLPLSQVPDSNCKNSDYGGWNYCGYLNSDYIYSNCDSSRTGDDYNGLSCTARIVKDGWKINY